MTRIIATSLIALAALAASTRADDLAAKITALAQPYIDDGTAVGFVIGVLKDGKTRYFAFGTTEKGTNSPPNENTVYEMGSVSKVFTGTLLADMVERGEVKLDDPVQKYLPKGVTMPMFGDAPITLEHLATHTSGLPRMPDNFEPKDPTNPYADYTVEQMYAFLEKHTLRRGPGEQEYSNLGMGLLGQLLADRAGMSYERLLTERITKPLGISDTRITLDDELRKRLAKPYNAALELESNWDIPAMAGAGAIRSTASDMLKFAQANLADDGRLSKAVHLAQTKRDLQKGSREMGLGWSIARDGITRWHNGMTGGYHAWLAVVPKFDVGVVLLANTASMKMTELGENVTRLACGDNVQPPKQRKEVEIDAKILAGYEGNYELAPMFSIRVTLEDGKLWAEATAQPKFRIFAESPTEFFYRVVDAQITFVTDDAGKATKLILHQGGRDIEGVRKEK
jgi:CubicO group peptidase (beta-lactamase class C family)